MIKILNRQMVIPKYGYYYFKPYIIMCLFFVFTGFTLIMTGAGIDQKYMQLLGFSLILYGILTTAGWLLARYIIPGKRVSVAQAVIENLQLGGSEKILDIGTGRGLFAIEAAKKLKSGKVIAIDLWDNRKSNEIMFHHKLSQPTGNTIDNAINNAKLAKVSDKIEFINMDANNLQFEENHFDIIICGYVISHLWKYSNRILSNINTILKKKGKILVIDSVRDFTYFLISTPHLFLLSLIRGTKAKWLKYENWIELVESNDFFIESIGKKRGIITIKALKTSDKLLQ